MSTSPVATWQITGATVRGAIHIRRNAPNQDAIAWRVPQDPSAPRCLAIADGHGAPLHLRSQQGARMAVRAAVGTLPQILAPCADDLSAVQSRATDLLPRRITERWRALVSEDLARRPLAQWELDGLVDRVSAASIARLDKSPELAYGSTLIAAFLHTDYVLLAQLGDGDILEVDKAGRLMHQPLPVDPLLLGNETTSLCMPEAHRHFRTFVQAVTDEEPCCVMLSTDGYANSFADSAGLGQAAMDLSLYARDDGLLELGRALPGWLRTTSTNGSGDDITVGLAVRIPAVE